MNTRSRRGLALVCTALLFAAMITAQVQVDRARPEIQSDDMRFLPNDKLLSYCTAGMSGVISDFVWLECIQYIAKENKGARSFEWLKLMLDVSTRLDPYFEDVYAYGGMFLATLRADDNAALELLDKGIVACPDSWKIPYQAAMVFLLNRRFETGSDRVAAHYLSISAATPNAPEHVALLATQLQTTYNLIEVEEQMWTSLAQNGSEVTRDLAKRKLTEIELRKVADALTERSKQFQRDIGRKPASLEELCQALNAPMPTDPLGGSFFMDDSGAMHNTTVLDDIKARYRKNIEAGIKAYREKFGVWPESLDATVEKKIMIKIPPEPYPGQDWEYDPQTGIVE